jgi:regulator of RNase E activity RraA
LTLAVERLDVETEAPELVRGAMTELVVAQRGDERGVTGEPCELDGGHRSTSGSGLPSVGHVRDLARHREMGYPEELRPFDVTDDR